MHKTIIAKNAPARLKSSNYPEPFASRMAGRTKHPLAELFGIINFGVNLTQLAPNSVSALHHMHSRQDEFIYVLEGFPTLIVGNEELALEPGMVAGFAAGDIPHHLENRTSDECVVLEVGDRSQSDEVSYPADDIQAVMGPGGKWHFAHKDGRPY